MKTLNLKVLIAAVSAGCLLTASAQQTDDSQEPPPADSNSPAAAQQAEPNVEQPDPEPQAAESAAQVEAQEPEQENQQRPTPSRARRTPPQRSVGEPRTLPTPAPSSTTSPETEKGLRLNFRGAPLETVLNYMSDAAGFIIILDPGTELKGKVDVWSNQPVSKEEALALLEKVLNQNGFTGIRNGRMLTIVNQKDAKKRDIPVMKGSDPDNIPKSDQIVTQIIPVRHANATQLTRDLDPLRPDYAEMTANENGNALVITATQADIRRLAEIVDAIDTSIASTSDLKVYALRNADAKQVATIIKELFDTQSNSNQRGNNNGGGRQFFNPFAGGGPGGFGGGAGGFGGRGGNAGGGRGNTASGSGTGGINARVVAVADERTNSLVVSAPDDLMATINRLVREIDVAVSDVTELRVFRLRNADPIEMADVLTNLFPDDTSSNENQSGIQFRGGFGGFGRGGGQRNQNNAGAQSDRMKKMGRVLAVADPRTSSIIVSAASDLMEQIADMVAQLDSDASKKQKVFVYSLENADAQNVEEILRDMFEGNNTRMNSNRQNNNQNNNALNNRAQQQQQFGGGGGGFGNNGGGGGGLGAGFR